VSCEGKKAITKEEAFSKADVFHNSKGIRLPQIKERGERIVPLL
jgi:hypothetical protein